MQKIIDREVCKRKTNIGIFLQNLCSKNRKTEKKKKNVDEKKLKQMIQHREKKYIYKKWQEVYESERKK